MKDAIQPRLRPALVLALDGASFDVIEPMLSQGRLPNLANWMAEGRTIPLPSTTPPVTFPAWSSFMTGLEPADHGIFDFSQKLPGEYRIRFVNASDRAGESLQSAVCSEGGKVLVLGLPATFPPEELDGLLVPGFDAPVSNGTDAEATSHPALYRRIAAVAGHWMRPDLKESAEAADFYETAVDTLLQRIERKTRFTLTALEEMRKEYDGRRPELAIVVFSESDTVGHHYWRDHDPASPRHEPNASAHRQDAVRSVYAALDRACGEIRDAYGRDALCVVLSDHGMGGASDQIIHLNAFLAETGFLRRRSSTGRLQAEVARRGRDTALRLLPARIAQPLFRRARGAAAKLESSIRFGGLDWSRTQAFSEEVNTQPGVWINLAGREAQGCVRPEDYETVRGRVISELLAWRLPDGGPVVAKARRREEAYDGPFLERAPDVVVELALDRGYGLSLVPTPWRKFRKIESVPSIQRLQGEALGGGRGRGMNGTHRNEGIFIATGGSEQLERARSLAPNSLVDVAGELAQAMGLSWHPRPGTRSLTPRPYSDQEDAIVSARLRALGYLD